MTSRPYHITELLPSVLERFRMVSEPVLLQAKEKRVPKHSQLTIQRIAKVISTRARTSISPTA